MLDKALGDDCRHHFCGVMRPLASVKAQREGQGVGEVIGGGGREAIGNIGHAATVAGWREQDKNVDVSWTPGLGPLAKV